MSRWKAYLESQPWNMRRCLHIVREEQDRKLGVVQELGFESIQEGMIATRGGGILGDSSLEEVDDFLRAIMDVAWDAGIRPTGVEDHTNELKATRFHLEDMRLLAKVRDK